jgi:hypothetical protein
LPMRTGRLSRQRPGGQLALGQIVLSADTGA